MCCAREAAGRAAWCMSTPTSAAPPCVAQRPLLTLGHGRRCSSPLSPPASTSWRCLLFDPSSASASASASARQCSALQLTHLASASASGSCVVEQCYLCRAFPFLLACHTLSHDVAFDQLGGELYAGGQRGDVWQMSATPTWQTPHTAPPPPPPTPPLPPLPSATAHRRLHPRRVQHRPPHQ